MPDQRHICDTNVSGGNYTVKVGKEWVTYSQKKCSVCGRVTQNTIIHRRPV